MSEIKKLSEDLKYWRAERPDEWVMDKLIQKAEELESIQLEEEKIIQITNIDPEGYCLMAITNRGNIWQANWMHHSEEYVWIRRSSPIK